MISSAKPVWTESKQINQFLQIKQSAFFEQKAPAVLQICAESEYAVYFNGRFVGNGQYHSFQNVRVYDEYDVTDFVCDGENTLLVDVNCKGENTQTHQMNTPMVVFALCCGTQMLCSGEDTLVRPHPFYESGKLELMTLQLGYTYHFDARGSELPWQKAVIVPESFHYQPRPIKRCVFQPLVEGGVYAEGTLQRTGTGTPAELIQQDGLFFHKKGEILHDGILKYEPDGTFFVLDLGMEYVGFIHLEIEAAEGTILDIGWGEHLEDLRVRTAINGRNFACRYIAKEGKQTFTGYFQRVGARYLQVHVTQMTGTVSLHKFGLIPLEYPISRQTEFVSSNDFISRLCSVGSRTLQLCMHEHYEDCPWREQALYAFDSYLQILSGYYLFGEYDFAKASLKLLADSQRPDGMIRMCAPTGIPVAIPSFSLTWVLSLEKYALYSGDVAFVREMLPTAERVLGAFQWEDDLIQNTMSSDNWHFYEWTDGLSGDANTPKVDVPIQAYYIMACEAYQKLCAYTGEPEHPVYHAPDAIRDAVRRRFYNAENGLFRTCDHDERYHALTQALVICSGISKDSALLDKLASGEGMMEATLSAIFFQYDALLSAGDQYKDTVLKQIQKIWGKMIYSGAVTLWEVAEGASAFSNAGSLCHGWSAIPVYLLYKYYLGFAPETPGFETYSLKPYQTTLLSEIQTTLFTPKWEKHVHVVNGIVEEC